MTRAIGERRAAYIADTLFEMNERLGDHNNTLAKRRMDLHNNRVGRSIGTQVSQVWRISYLFGHELSRSRALDVEFRRVETRCWAAAWDGRLRVRP